MSRILVVAAVLSASAALAQNDDDYTRRITSELANARAAVEKARKINANDDRYLKGHDLYFSALHSLNEAQDYGSKMTKAGRPRVASQLKDVARLREEALAELLGRLSPWVAKVQEEKGDRRYLGTELSRLANLAVDDPRTKRLVASAHCVPNKGNKKFIQCD